MSTPPAPYLSFARRCVAAGACGWLLVALGCSGGGTPLLEKTYDAKERYECKPHTVMVSTDAVKTFALSSEQAAYLDTLLEPVFGTPRSPLVQLTEAKADIDALQLTPDALATGSKSFLNLCAHCHGKEGNGLGKSAEFLNPKPRDFRQGKFKYVTTVRTNAQGKPDTAIAAFPARSDLLKTITNGIPGAGMLKTELPDEKMNPLVSYVIHLSLRGQVEYRLTRLWLEELSDGEKPNDKDVARELKEIVKLWAADAGSIYQPQVPWEDIARQGEKEQWATGRMLFLSKDKGGCTECHGKSGTADPVEVPAILTMKDDWGSAIRPRNYTTEPLRGGDRPIDLFYRIKLGIKPSRMQAADTSKLTDADIWHLVGYVRSLEKKPTQ